MLPVPKAMGTPGSPPETWLLALGAGSGLCPTLLASEVPKIPPRIRVWVLLCLALQHMGIAPLKLNFRGRHLIRLSKVGFSLSQVSVLSGF